MEHMRQVNPRFDNRRIEALPVSARDYLTFFIRRYSYGKPVKGKLLLKSTPQIPTWRRKPNLPEIHYETEVSNLFDRLTN